MRLLLLALGVLASSGLASLAAYRRPAWATRFGVAGAVAGCSLGLVAALLALVSAGTPPALRLAWSVPGGSFHVGIDRLSAFFLLPLFGLSGVSAVYGGAYLERHRGARSLGPPWLFFHALVACMALVVVARNALLFLVAWECMTIAAFFLVTFDHERDEVREAGWIFLVASHLGGAFLLAMFALLGRAAGSLDFDAMARVAGMQPATAGLVFALAVVGFGTKAGWVPLHGWLPRAHPVAPSHVSALLSGVLVKLGIYGLLRVLGLLTDSVAPWWGWLLVGIGAVSGIYGILYALAQSDLKRMLAYSTVENTGLIAIGLGLGILGQATGQPVMRWLGFAGALVHVLNHAVFKGLLFLGAGAVQDATGTTEMDRLGGLARQMPWTCAAFVAGAAAIAALPASAGFLGEFLILLGAYTGLVSTGQTIAGLAAIVAIAMIAGLVALAFARAVGIVCCGSPRDADVPAGADPPLSMRGALAFLAAVTVVLGVGLPWAVSDPRCLPIEAIGLPAVQLRGLGRLALALASFFALVALVALVRSSLLARRATSSGPTWGCGYLRPSARMQYTASSFADPILSLFAPLVRLRRRLAPPVGLFPHTASLEVDAVDPAAGMLYTAAFAALERGLGWMRWLQQGRVQLYVLYIAATLVVLLLWAATNR